MKTRIEKYIPIAITIIRQGIGMNNMVAEEYDGYAASLGPAIIASGLLPAVSFYSDVHKAGSEDKPHRYEILVIIAEILRTQENIDVNTEKNGLLVFLLNKTQAERESLKPLIMDAVVAIKLSLRNFNQDKSQ